MSGNNAQAELDLDLGEEGPDVEVIVEEPTTDAANAVEVEADTSDDEFQKSENQTQKRINRLTKKMREAEKSADEATRFAQIKARENEELAKRLNQMDNSYVDQYSGRVESELNQTEASLRSAMEIGDTEAAVAAQRKMTQLAVEADRAAQAKASNERRQRQPIQQQPVAQAPAPTARPDPKAEQWAQKNDWFGEDSAMTYAAFGIHKEIVESEGIDPKSDEYYDVLDRRMKDEFPHKFKDGVQNKRPAQTVASVNRSVGTGRSSGNKVRLTSRQVAMAKKLGVTLEQYAKYVKE
jgi:hypothetical protein|tara:strand:- start:64 stop:948 length:885 start_codon:yes stop_codon:yes gene_type:complete